MKRFRELILIFFLTLYCCNSQNTILGKRLSMDNNYAITLPNKNYPNHVRLEVRSGDIASNGGRAEIIAENSAFEEEYSFSFKVVKYKYESEKHFILADWHHATALHKFAKEKGENLYSPLVVHLIGDNIVLANRAGRFTGKVGNLKLQPSFLMNMLRVPVNYQGWNHVYVKIKWSDSNKGAIYAKINSKKVRKENIRTTYDMAYANFFKVGIYRNLTYKTDAVFEFKNMKVGDRLLVPNFSRRLTGEKNNNKDVIKSIQEKHN